MLSFTLMDYYFRRRINETDENDEIPTDSGGDSVETQSSQSVSFILAVLGELIHQINSILYHP